MAMESVDDLLNDIYKKYNKNPLGWKISRANHKGFGNIYFTNSKEVWQIKVDSVYKPKPIGLGMKIGDYSDNENLFDKNSPNYGLRSINDDYLNKIMKSYELGENLDPLIREMLKKDPTSSNDAGSAVMNGPIQFRQNNGYISKRQKEMDLKLKESLHKLLHRRGYGSEWV